MFALAPKRDSGFPKNIHWHVSQNVFLEVPYSLVETKVQFSKCSRLPAWQHFLISMFWPQEQYPILANYAVWKSRFAEYLRDYTELYTHTKFAQVHCRLDESSKNLHSILRHRKEIYTSFNLILMQYETDWRHKRELFIYWFFNLNDVFSKAVLKENPCYDSSNCLFAWKTNQIPRNTDFMRSVFANVIMIFNPSILVIICRDKNHLDPNCFVSAQEYVFQVLSG